MNRLRSGAVCTLTDLYSVPRQVMTLSAFGFWSKPSCSRPVRRAALSLARRVLASLSANVATDGSYCSLRPVANLLEGFFGLRYGFFLP